MPLYVPGKLLYNIKYLIMGGAAVNCMKCGRETKSDAVFCRECLEHMEKYPISDHTLVYVPTEKDRAASVKNIPAAHPAVSVEDQVKRMHRKVEILRLLLILFMGASLFFGVLSAETLHELKLTNLIGKNYTAGVATGAADAAD